jgi:type I restriction enzyme M protein
MLLPGQEDVVVTKEVLVLRPGKRANFDPFYLAWAMTLSIVRDQWRRIVFMQTNREDVGERYLEIRIPIPTDRSHADEASKPFREYYLNLAKARGDLQNYLTENPNHHFFIGSAREGAADLEAIEEDAAAEVGIDIET